MAHVKWFCSSADVKTAPLAFARVMTPMFAAVLLVFLAMVFVGFIVDGIAARRWPLLVSCGERFDAQEEKLVRIAVGAFFLLLWDKGAVVFWDHGDRVVLTPELNADLPWVGATQFIIAASVATRLTCVVSAIGICVLFVFGITQFGLFHMTDYVFFPGIAAYLALTWHGTPEAIRLRVPLLSGGLAFGLMWTAVEKLLYPQWTLDIVSQHAGLAFGFPHPFAVLVAALVEFTLAFFIMTGRGLVRFGAAGYALIFLAAIPEFGHLDAVGHMPIIGILAAVCLHGASPLQRLLRVHGFGRVLNAAAIAAIYVVSLGAMIGMYYGLHAAEYG